MPINPEAFTSAILQSVLGPAVAKSFQSDSNEQITGVADRDDFEVFYTDEFGNKSYRRKKPENSVMSSASMPRPYAGQRNFDPGAGPVVQMRPVSLSRNQLAIASAFDEQPQFDMEV